MTSFGYILSTCRILTSNSHGLGLLTLCPCMHCLVDKGILTSLCSNPILWLEVCVAKALRGLCGRMNSCQVQQKRNPRQKKKDISNAVMKKKKKANLQVNPGDPIFESWFRLGKFWVSSGLILAGLLHSLGILPEPTPGSTIFLPRFIRNILC